MNKKILIIQYSPPHTASTILTNILYGLIEELHDKPVAYFNEKDIKNEDKVGKLFEKRNVNVIKMHCSEIMTIDKIISLYDNEYDTYFFCSERKKEDLFIDAKYKNKNKYKNVFVFTYEQLNEKQNKIDSVISLIYNNIYHNINYISLNIDNAIDRIKNMDMRYEQIKHLPFSYVDEFYHIHGSHKNRIP